MDRLEKKMLLQKKLEDSSKELKDTVDDFRTIGKDVLLIGGVLLLAYALFLFLSSESEKEKENSGIWQNGLKGIVVSTLLALAKEKLQEYLQQGEED